MTIKVTINNKIEKLGDGITVAELLILKKMKRAAVWINGTQILASEYKSYIIKEEDNIRLLRIIAGG